MTRESVIFNHAALIQAVAQRPGFDPVADDIHHFYGRYLCVIWALQRLAEHGVVRLETKDGLVSGSGLAPTYQRGCMRAWVVADVDPAIIQAGIEAAIKRRLKESRYAPCECDLHRLRAEGWPV